MNTTQREKNKETKRGNTLSSDFVKPCIFLYWLTTLSQKLLREKVVQHRGCQEPRLAVENEMEGKDGEEKNSSKNAVRFV